MDMAGESVPKCSACGAELGPKSQEIYDPDKDDGEHGDEHFVVIRGEKGERLKCSELGQIASVELESPGQGEGTPPNQESGGEERQGSQPEQEGGRKPPGGDNVYKFDEDKTPMDILKEVATNPTYGLTDPQLKELSSWASDYDGQMPPQVLEDILQNFEGVQKQTAQLMRQRYELKLNKYIQEQTQNEAGPPIGALSRGRFPHPGSPGGSANAPPTPSPQEIQKNLDEEDEDSPDLPRSDQRQERREERRDALDEARRELAVGAAENLASEAGTGILELRQIGIEVLKSKARKDPEWFFELTDRLDIDPIELLEPSEERKREMRQQEQQQAQTEVDREIDEALNNTIEETQQPQEREEEVDTQEYEEMEDDFFDDINDEHVDETETVNRTGSDVENETDMAEPEGKSEEDEEFEELFSEVQGGE